MILFRGDQRICPRDLLTILDIREVYIGTIYYRGACVITCWGSEDDSPAVIPTDDSSQFVTLTDVVPDAYFTFPVKKLGQ